MTELKTLIEEAKAQMESHPSKDARFFAKKVFDFLSKFEVIEFSLAENKETSTKECPVKNDGTMVGSIRCQQCKSNIETNHKNQYVICSGGVK